AAGRRSARHRHGDGLGRVDEAARRSAATGDGCRGRGKLVHRDLTKAVTVAARASPPPHRQVEGGVAFLVHAGLQRDGRKGGAPRQTEADPAAESTDREIAPIVEYLAGTRPQR